MARAPLRTISGARAPLVFRCRSWRREALENLLRLTNCLRDNLLRIPRQLVRIVRIVAPLTKVGEALCIAAAPLAAQVRPKRTVIVAKTLEGIAEVVHGVIACVAKCAVIGSADCRST